MGKLRQRRGSDSPKLTQQEKRISITSQQLVQSPVLQAALPLVPQVPEGHRRLPRQEPTVCAAPTRGDLWPGCASAPALRYRLQ